MSQVMAAYQDEAYQWLRNHDRGILADDMGVGKTLPAIRAAMYIQGLKLVVAPAYLLTNWAAYLEEEGVNNVQVVRGNKDTKVDQLIPRTSSSWVIVSYDTLARRDYEIIASKIPWNVVIADECHRLRGRNSKRTNMAYRLFKQIPIFWGLTGTPMPGNAGDVFPLLKLCNPRIFTSYWRFVEDNARIEITPWAKVVHGPRNQQAFNTLLRPYMFRRTIEEVLPDLPEAVETIIRVDVSEATRTRLKMAKEQYLIDNPDGLRSRVGAGGLITACRQIVNEDGVKQEALKGLIEDIPQDEPLIVFCWHRAFATAVATVLEEAGRQVALVTGEGSIDSRADAILGFQGGKYDTIVATIASIQEGVNLQRAKYAIFMEQDWVAASNNQALARLRRRGQTGTVLKFVIIARRTADESVHKAALKRATMNEVFDDLWRGEWDRY
jgi:SNF2 family DNA or RNA helicase